MKSTLPDSLIPSKKFRILIAEDIPSNQLLILKFLEILGYEAKAVANGKEAITELNQNAYDLILMDVQMPEMDGYEATQQIRRLEDPLRKNIPILALTANSVEEDIKKCLEAGMNDFLSKPVKKSVLHEKLTKWLK
jgi:CheY-like chemotaxis protein